MIRTCHRRNMPFLDLPPTYHRYAVSIRISAYLLHTGCRASLLPQVRRSLCDRLSRESPASRTYSGFITDITDITLTPDANDEAVIYWIWPNTLGQIALDSSLEADRAYLSNGAVSVLKHDVCEPSKAPECDS